MVRPEPPEKGPPSMPPPRALAPLHGSKCFSTPPTPMAAAMPAGICSTMRVSRAPLVRASASSSLSSDTSSTNMAAGRHISTARTAPGSASSFPSPAPEPPRISVPTCTLNRPSVQARQSSLFRCRPASTHLSADCPVPRRPERVEWSERVAGRVPPATSRQLSRLRRRPLMKKAIRCAACALALVASAGCQAEEPAAEGASMQAFVGARLIDGSGGAPLERSVIVVREGIIQAIGAEGEVDIPEGAQRIDLSGRTVIPGLINAHGHVGDVRGLESGQYSREHVLDQLGRYARYGITTVVSLGDDQEEGVRIRDEQSDPG